ncbi:MAG TPA: DUF3558 domain-containing protein [Pseudonocardiaceae bacterium]|jgi:hypothetical protein|nr:DUF3558 domain-containing protein [Pseudonocardiaceae bacterium]
MRRIPVWLALAALLAACSAGGPQTRDEGTAPNPAASASADPIPPVRDPKNLAGTPPCQLLTPAQLASNQMDLAAQPKNVLDAPGCEWDNKAHTRQIRIYVDTTNDVLHNVYAQRATFPVFEITQVAGHPAIRTKNNATDTSCFFRVAAGARQTVVVRFTSLRQGLEEPCGPARALAEDVMANLPPLKG